MVQKDPPPQQRNSLNVKDNMQPLPCYSSHGIMVTSILMGSGYISRVSVQELDLCCKISTAVAQGSAARV